jgi:hypothetical protein
VPVFLSCELWRSSMSWHVAASYAVAFRRQSIAVPGRPGMLWASALGTICVGLPRVRASYKHAVCLWPSSCGLTQLSGRSAVVTSSAGCCGLLRHVLVPFVVKASLGRVARDAMGSSTG